MKELTPEERKREAEETGKELRAIAKGIEEYQIRVFGRYVSGDEENEKFWDEYEAERVAKYKDMSIEEYLVAKKAENAEIDRELLEMGVDPELLRGD